MHRPSQLAPMKVNYPQFSSIKSDSFPSRKWDLLVYRDLLILLHRFLSLGQVLSSPKTPIRAAQATATPISYSVSAATAQSILSPNAVASSMNNQQTQIIITTSAPIPTLVSSTIAQPKTQQQQFKNIVSSVAVQQQPTQIQQQPGVRIVNAPSSNVRVLSSGQTVRIASSQPATGQVGSPIGSTTTILRQQPTTVLNSTASPIVSAGND